MAIRVANGVPRLSYLRIPHPSGLVVDRENQTVHLASTRNPNQLFELRPAGGLIPRADTRFQNGSDRPLVPTGSSFLPGALYLHDLALLGGSLLANAVGENAVVRLGSQGRYERVWWPRCIEVGDEPIFDRNHIQLNSIAAGPDLAGSYFSASSSVLSTRRPGHLNFPVDGKGVIFSGTSRDPVVRGLTRPHSARLYEDRLWMDNSGYGELAVQDGDRAQTVARLPGWTRGLCFQHGIAFVGTSRVIARFRRYAPGLEVDSSICAVHAVDTESGRVLGKLTWPNGQQIFALDWMPNAMSSGFVSTVGRPRNLVSERDFYYAFNSNRER